MIYKSNPLSNSQVLFKSAGPLNINEYFDKIFYINMEKDSDRNLKMIEQFKQYGITNYQRVEGVAPNHEFKAENIALSEIRNFIKCEAKYIIGGYFCRASHLKTIQYAKEKGYDRILILEDDALFLEDPNSLLNSNINLLNDWDMLFFGGLVEPHFRNQIVETHAYCLNKKLYDDILNMAVPSGMEIDNFYAKIIQQMSYNYNQSGKYNIRMIIPFNRIIQDKNFKSNI